VTGSDQTTETIQAAKSVIATGSEANPFPGLPFDEKVVISSTGALSLPSVPSSMIVVGGGVIGLELGSVYQRLGTKVTVVEYLEEICTSLDLEVAKTLHKILERQGITILTSHKVVSGTNNGKTGQIIVEALKSGEKQTLTADHILIATGRRPNTENLHVEAAGVKLDEKGRVAVDDQLRTNVANIWAIGDVVRGPMLAHKAEEEGIFVAEQIAGRPCHINYHALPAIIYTYPEVATVGHSEEELKKNGTRTPTQESNTQRDPSPSSPTRAPKPSPTPTA
jgi:dihydrolipoamide dehydrogenase